MLGRAEQMSLDLLTFQNFAQGFGFSSREATF